MAYTVQDLIEKLGLRQHPEGGWYAFVQASGVSVPGAALPGGFSGELETCSLIYYLLRRGETSRWHQLKATEIWAWHQGGSLTMTLGGAGDRPTAEGELLLGPRLEQGEQFHLTVPADQWQTTRVTEGDFVLVSCIVAPGFRDEDCVLPAQPLDNEINQEGDF